MKDKITKNDLIDKIYSKSNKKIERQVIQAVVEDFISSLKGSLEDGATIELRGFGTFEPRLRKGRSVAHNPKTGEKVSVEPHYVAAFRAGKELKANLWDLKNKDDK
ncbi:MAG: integration host factor subunit beta [Treponema sp.]|nr:integration host factor subunit beta [Treponema sp.]